MLNRQSFNLMKELNESDEVEVKKKVLIESTGVVTEEVEEKLEESVTEDNKEDRLASLKIQLEKDGDQLAADEKAAIEAEIANLEKEVYNEGCSDKLNEDEGDSTFTLKINCNGEAFEGEPEVEVSRILNDIASNLEYTDEKSIMDINGNIVGKYGFGFEGVMESALTEDIESDPYGYIETDADLSVGNEKEMESKYNIKIVDVSDKIENQHGTQVGRFYGKKSDLKNYFANDFQAQDEEELNFIMSLFVEESESALTEEYDEDLGGNLEDYISDMKQIQEVINGIDTTTLASHKAIGFIDDLAYTIEELIKEASNKANVSEGQVEDAKVDSIEKGLYSESEEGCSK